MAMIPKRIFYVWGYGEEKSKLANVCIENWRDKLPDYEIIEVNEKTPEWFDFDYEYNNCLWFKTVYDLKMWAYVSDYMRVKVLYDHGGIYFDTDVTVYKDFEPLLNHKMFIGMMINNIPEMAICGAQKNNPVLKNIFNFYQNEIWKSKEYIIINIINKILQNDFNIIPTNEHIIANENITIYPYEYFYPYHYSKEFSHSCITDKTYTVHWQNAAWINKKTLFFMTNKHRIPLNALIKQMDFIEKVDKNANEKVKI